MKILTKHSDFLKTRVLPMLLVMTLIVATFSVAFTVSDINVFAQSIEDADYRDVSVDKNDADSSKAFWVDATYYDYLSDEELKPDKGWLNPIQAGTDIEGYNEGDDQWEDNWYPFYQFNNFISSNAGSWTYPLYLGNFCNTYDAYNYSKTFHNGPYTEATKGLTRFDYISNNSNGLKSYNTSIKGLAAANLDSSGTIQGSGATTKMPYFDDELLDKSPLAEVITSYFPFRQKTDGNVTTYSFDSTGAKDNVFFRWNGTTPISVGYGQGEAYGVKDGLGRFMSGETSGYGIFPFNNTAATSQGRGGNNNLDYGFGIKLDIDFKVPENGLLPDGKPVKFNYSGDDDLWVYLSEVDGDNSQLILDLGGAHKMAEGSIDFSTMTATAKSTVNAGSTSTDKGLYIYDNYGWGDNLRVWAWNTSTGQEEWYYPTFDSATGTYYLSSEAIGSSLTPLSSMTNFKVAKGNWEDESDKEDTLSNHYNHITYVDNLEYVGEAVNPTVEGKEETTKFGFESDGKGGYKTLEPNKIYHLTIFYMERGLIESNCNMSFTMTPAQNNVEITNKVDLTDINPALWDDIKNNESFNFEITDGTTSLTKALKDGENIEYDNDFDTHSNLTVKQTTNSNLSYTTSWNVVDKADHDKVLYESKDDSKDTDVFELVNGRDHHDTASMQVNYVNTPLSAPLEITKSIKSANGDVVSDVDTFNYTMLVDINGGTDYKAYPLTYTVGDKEETMSENGEFSFSSSDTVTVKGLPVGVTYQITENLGDGSGYTAEENPISGKVNEGSNSAGFANKQDPTEPPTTEPPTTEPPTTEPPTTEPPTTEPPTTEPPTTEPPTTEPPTTEPPTTEPPTTEPPTTEPPTTEPPTTEPPTTEPPTTEPPTEPEPTPYITKTIVNSKLTDSYTTAAIGDKVTFELKAAVVGTKSNKLNEYVIVDEMSEGLTFGKILSVTLDGKTTLTSSDYTVEQTDTGFEVSLADSQIKSDEFYTYKEVVVTYTATLNDDAVIGADGNPNSDSLKWVDSADVSHDEDGDEVVVYTFQIDVYKVIAGSDDPLEGVTFAIYKSEVDAENGKNAIETVKTDEEGIASFVGLDAGTYYVRETKTVKGYNLNTKVYTVNIKPKFNGGELSSPEDGIVSVTIENTPAQLPKTGVHSTAMFSIIGMMLIGAAAILFLIAMRRKAYADLQH